MSIITLIIWIFQGNVINMYSMWKTSLSSYNGLVSFYGKGIWLPFFGDPLDVLSSLNINCFFLFILIIPGFFTQVEDKFCYSFFLVYIFQRLKNNPSLFPTLSNIRKYIIRRWLIKCKTLYAILYLKMVLNMPFEQK